MLSELYSLSQAGAWGNGEKPKHDMAFLLIVPDKTIEGERVFSLVAVWAHQHQPTTTPWLRQHISLHC